jgi:subtilase family serine protease
LALLAPWLGAAQPARAQTAAPKPATRIVGLIDNTRLVKLKGNTRPELAHGKDLGEADPTTPFSRMQLLLQRSPEQQAALDAFMAEQQDPQSPNFHHWLSPDQFGQLYGPSDADVATLTAWLKSEGFTVSSVSKGRLAIEFSGTAGQLKQAFHTELHRYTVNGEAHIANSSDPQIPEAISPVVMGVLGLNDFRAKSRMTKPFPLQRDPATGRMAPLEPQASVLLPQYTKTQGSNYYVAPGDFATIYNSTPLLNAGINGAGVTIAIVGGSTVTPSDIATYRTMFGLPDNPYTLVVNGINPGLVAGYQDENTLDVEMAGMAAPGAKIVLVASYGVYGGADAYLLSQLYIIDNQLAPIMSSSYGDCELNFGTAKNAFQNALTQQGSAEGISQFASAGDAGAADCENHDAVDHVATTGLQADGLSGTPYEVSVGGTDFADTTNYTTYWSNTNSATGTSAKSYIPEVPWNGSCTNPLIWDKSSYTSATAYCNNYVLQINYLAQELIVSLGGGGGVSNCTAPTGTTPATCAGGYAKPSWQAGPGVPADGKRDTPDVSLFAASGGLGNSWAFYEKGSLLGFGGTSASTPAMAGLMALVVQAQGSAQGLPNPVFYKLAAAQTTANCNSNTVAAGNACVFNDITSGNNEVPCANNSPNCVNGTSIGVLSGNSATVGYDITTGLGSVNAYNLVNAWSTQSGTPAISVTLSPTTLPGGNVGTQYFQQVTAGGGTMPYTYALSSGTLPAGLFLTPGGLLGGTPTGIGASTFTITACDSTLLNGPACGSQAYTLTIAAALANSGTINWSPGATFTYNGLPIGATVLDATTTNGGTVSYGYTVSVTSSTGPQTGFTDPALATTVLPPGPYVITATNSADSSTATINFTVLQQHEWIINAAGNLTGLDAAGNLYVSKTTGGGLGIAVDGGGTVWSANTAGTSLATFSNVGALFQAGPSGGGLNTPSAIAVDGAGAVWVANGNSSVSEFTNLGTALSPSTGFTGGSISSPTGIAVDQAGNVWVSNGGNNSITEILGAATPVAPVAAAVTNNTVGAKP